MTRIAHVLISVCLGLALCGCSGLPSEDKAAVYGQVIRERVKERLPSIEGAPVYLVGWTVGDEYSSAGVQGAGEAIGPDIRRSITDSLTDLPCEFIWVEDSSDVPSNDNTGRPIASISVGNVVEVDTGVEVACVLYVEDARGHSLSALTYTLEKRISVWDVTDTSDEWQCL